MISRGFPSYNCQFNLAKTSSNLQSEDQTVPAVFCGALLDLRSREIFPKYSSYANTNLYFLQRWPSLAEAEKPTRQKCVTVRKTRRHHPPGGPPAEGPQPPAERP